MSETNNTGKPNQEPRKALGRGLAALLGERSTDRSPSPAVNHLTNQLTKQNTEAEASSTLPKDSAGNEARFVIEEVELSKIEPNPEQPRKHFNTAKLEELASSLKEHGVVQPIVVKKLSDQKYQIVAGERRWRAANLAGLAKLPVIVRESKVTELDNDLASLVENIQREDLSPIELAIAYDRLIQIYKYTQEVLAQKLGVSRVSVANTLRLLKLPESIKAMIAAKTLSEGHSRALLALENDQQMIQMAELIVSQGLTVRDVEMRVRARANFANSMPSANGQQKMPAVNEHAALEDELRNLLGTKIVIQGNEKRGTIEIYYAGKESLHRLIHQLRSLKS